MEVSGKVTTLRIVIETGIAMMKKRLRRITSGSLVGELQVRTKGTLQRRGLYVLQGMGPNYVIHTHMSARMHRHRIDNCMFMNAKDTGKERGKGCSRFCNSISFPVTSSLCMNYMFIHVHCFSFMEKRLILLLEMH